MRQEIDDYPLTVEAREKVPTFCTAVHSAHAVTGESVIDRGAAEVVIVRLEIATRAPGVKHVGAVAVGDRAAAGLLVAD